MVRMRGLDDFEVIGGRGLVNVMVQGFVAVQAEEKLMVHVPP
jgi:hypothetical protein